MELQLVSFEQAKGLKELGFPQEVHPWHLYDVHTGILYKDYDDYSQVYLTENDTCMAPTLELAAKWLREEKNILIEPRTKSFSTNGFFKCFVLNCSKDCTKCAEYQIYWTDFGGDNVCFPNWETALSAGIDKAIKILKSK